MNRGIDLPGAMRPALFVPESIRALRLLQTFRENRNR
jgi:CBS domain containing-hemolysin-like protein